MKAALASEEAIKSDTVAQASVEHYALKLFAHADTEDRAGRYNKYVELSLLVVYCIKKKVNYFSGLKYSYKFLFSEDD